MSTAPELLRGLRPTWAEISLDQFTRNVEIVAGALPAGARLVAVLKADAYGHGAVELARCCSPDRVAMIAVALLEEALELRQAGIALPILVFGALDEQQIVSAAENGITIGIPGPESLERACAVAREREVTVHLKLDSGMGRMGLVEADLGRAVEMIRSAPQLKLAAIYTHFATADDAKSDLTETQIANFDRMLDELRNGGIDVPLHHFANSAATLRGLVRPGDFARVGIALYGPSRIALNGRFIEPVMRWRTEIARLKPLAPGHAIGYGATYHTKRESRIATLPVGYADGFNRLQSNHGDVLVRGKRAPIVGRVSMDLVTIDVTDIRDAAVGDEAVLLGTQGDAAIDAEEIAARIGTISYEVLCAVSARVPRLYRGAGDVRIRSRFLA